MRQLFYLCFHAAVEDNLFTILYLAGNQSSLDYPQSSLYRFQLVNPLFERSPRLIQITNGMQMAGSGIQAPNNLGLYLRLHRIGWLDSAMLLRYEEPTPGEWLPLIGDRRAAEGYRPLKTRSARCARGRRY